MSKNHSIPALKAKNLPPIEINFHDTSIIAIKRDNQVYIAAKPISEAIGIDWGGQRKKLIGDKDKFRCRHMSIPSQGGTQSTLCLPLKKLNGWLFTISPERVKPAIRDKVIAYQDECFSALHDYFHHGAAINPRIPESPATKQLPDQAGPLKRADNKIKKLKSDKQWMEGRIRGLEAENIILKDSLAIAERFAEEFKELAKSAHQLCRGAQRLCSDAFDDLDKKRMNESRAWEEDETADSHERREQLGNYMLQ